MTLWYTSRSSMPMDLLSNSIVEVFQDYKSHMMCVGNITNLKMHLLLELYLN